MLPFLLTLLLNDWVFIFASFLRLIFLKGTYLSSFQISNWSLTSLASLTLHIGISISSISLRYSESLLLAHCWSIVILVWLFPRWGGSILSGWNQFHLWIFRLNYSTLSLEWELFIINLNYISHILGLGIQGRRL